MTFLKHLWHGHLFTSATDYRSEGETCLAHGQGRSGQGTETPPGVRREVTTPLNGVRLPADELGVEEGRTRTGGRM